MTSADIVVIGGGVMGASAAYHLALRGCPNILVLERGPDHSLGSTLRATGGFRSQFSTAVNVRLSLLSRSKLLYFSDELGVDPGYQQRGYLFAAGSAEHMQTLRSGQRIQHEAGLKEVREISPEDIRRLNPHLRFDGIVGGMFCPTDGFISPSEILRGYVEGAKRKGVRFRFGVECLDMILINGSSGFTRRIAEVVTNEGNISCGTVVNAAGPWAARVGEMAQVGIPVIPAKRQIAVTAPTDVLPPDMPMTIFTEDGFHLRVRDGRVILLLPPKPDSPASFDTGFETAWLQDIRKRVCGRAPILADTPIDTERCIAGLYEMSPDRHVILGPAPGLDNFYLMNGSSGHGVMHSPAIGQLVAETIVEGRATSMNTHALRPERFLEGEPNISSDIL